MKAEDTTQSGASEQRGESRCHWGWGWLLIYGEAAFDKSGTATQWA